MPTNTDVVAADAKTATDEVTPEEVTTQPSDTGIQKRIDGLTAEKGRLATQLEAERMKNAELVEKHKTEDEKRLDEMVTARVDAEYGSKLQRLENLEKELAVKRDKLMESVPEERRGMIDPDATIERQITQAEGVLQLLKIETTVDPITGSGNPAPAPAAQRYTADEWQTYMQLAFTDAPKFRERQAEMEKAYREGRVDIPPKRGIFASGALQVPAARPLPTVKEG